MFDKNICSFAPLPLFVYLMKDNTGSFELAPCKNVTLLHSTALILIDTKLVSCKSHQIPFCVWYCCYKWSIVKQKHCKLQASSDVAIGNIVGLEARIGIKRPNQVRWNGRGLQAKEIEPDSSSKRKRGGFHQNFHQKFSQFLNLSFFPVSRISRPWVASPLGRRKGLWPESKCGATAAG